MSYGETKQKTTMTRAEVARWLTDLARAIEGGGPAEIELAGAPVTLTVPEQVRCELEIEQGRHEVELEIELKWRPM